MTNEPASFTPSGVYSGVIGRLNEDVTDPKSEGLNVAAALNRQREARAEERGADGGDVDRSQYEGDGTELDETPTLSDLGREEVDEDSAYAGKIERARRNNTAPPSNSNWHKWAKKNRLGVVDLDSIASAAGYDDFDHLDLSISPADAGAKLKRAMTKATESEEEDEPVQSWRRASDEDEEDLPERDDDEVDVLMTIGRLRRVQETKRRRTRPVEEDAPTPRRLPLKGPPPTGGASLAGAALRALQGK